MSFRSPLLVACTLFVLSSCSSATKKIEENTQYYQLDEASEIPTSSSNPRWVVGLGPVEIPSYLDRPQLLKRGRDGQLYAHDLHRWESPLRSQIHNQLKLLLSKSRRDIQIEDHPFRHAHRIDYQWRVEMQSFEHTPNGRLSLKAKIELRDLRKQSPTAERIVEISEPVEDKDFASLVSAMQKCLQSLASEMRSLLPLEAYVVDPKTPESDEVSQFD